MAQKCLASLVTVLLLGGCTAPNPDALLPTTSDRSGIFSADYMLLSSCTYEAVERAVGSGLRKADLPASRTSKITFDPSGVQYWELIFRADADRSTSVTFVPARNMWGSDAGG